MTRDEMAKVSKLANALNKLGESPADLLQHAIFAQRRAAHCFVEKTECEDGRDDLVIEVQENAVEDLLRDGAGDGRYDPLYSPGVLRYVSSLRSKRGYLGDDNPAIGKNERLDSLAKAIAVRPRGRGRRPHPHHRVQQDQIEYGTYMRIEHVMAAELGRPIPRRSHLPYLTELAWTRQEFEPHLSQQLEAYRKSSVKKGSISLSDRAALVLLAMHRDRTENRKPVTDADADEARTIVKRLEKALREAPRSLPSH